MAKEIVLYLQDNYFMLIYGVALILSVLKYRYYYDSHLKALPIVIGYVLLTEILGYLIRDFEDIQIVFEKGYSDYNHLIFNILNIIFFLYFFNIYKKSFTRIKSKKIILIGMVGFLITCTINTFFQDFVLDPQLGLIAYGSLLLVISVYLYFRELRGKLAQRSNYHKLLRWISMGFLIFYPFYPFIITIGYLNVEIYDALHLRQILLALIAILYGCFVIGFLKLKRIKF